ncbi:MAG: MgtC/SapB family protein [Parcubacteria group bacterium]
MTIFLSLTLALFLGVCLGFERSFAKKTAGVRTYGLVSLGSALFIIISRLVIPTTDLYAFDPMRIAAGVVMGIGFLCGGVIIFKGNHLSGLTTAAGLWVAAGIGMAVGYGLSSLAIFTTILTLFTFTILWFIEHRITGNGEKPVGQNEG